MDTKIAHSNKKRQLIESLFPVEEKTAGGQRVYVSLQSWKALVRRLNQLELECKKNQQSTTTLIQLIQQRFKENKAQTEVDESLLDLGLQLKKCQKERQLIKKALSKNEQKINQLLERIKTSRPLWEDSLF